MKGDYTLPKVVMEDLKRQQEFFYLKVMKGEIQISEDRAVKTKEIYNKIKLKQRIAKMKEKTLYILAAVLALGALFGINQARAETYQQGKVKIVFKNKCPDLVGDDWSCLNKTQASQSQETIEQVLEAVKNTKYKGKLTIHSIDPKRPSKDVWEFGAWKKGKVIKFAAMPGCPNAREELEQLLRVK